MNTWLKENWFKSLTAFIVTLVGLSFSYYLIFLIPKQEQLKLQQRDAETFRQECKKEMQDDFKFFDESSLSPELINVGLKNKGYIDEAGKFIDDDVWIAKCVQEKMSITL